jgi:hypothetical protein
MGDLLDGGKYKTEYQRTQSNAICLMGLAFFVLPIFDDYIPRKLHSLATVSFMRFRSMILC